MPLIRGRVVDRAGTPVSGAAIYVIAAPVSLPDVAQLSGEDGRFTLSVPAAGTYVVGARADPAGSGQTTLIVEGSQDTAGDIVLGDSLR